jgi:hypothetical protein
MRLCQDPQFSAQALHHAAQDHGARCRFVLSSPKARRAVRRPLHQDLHLQVPALATAPSLVSSRPASCSDDKFYETHVIKFDVLDPIMRVFAQCHTRNNLVASCILDLFERLRKDSSIHKALIEHVCTRHADALRAADVACVKQLIERYEQQCEHSGSGGAVGDASSAGRPAVYAAPKVARTSLHRAGRDIGDDDESYFDRDTEEDSGGRCSACCSIPPHADLHRRTRFASSVRRCNRRMQGAFRRAAAQDHRASAVEEAAAKRGRQHVLVMDEQH